MFRIFCFRGLQRPLMEQVDPRWRRGVDDAVMIVKRDYGTREARMLQSVPESTCVTS